MIYLFMVGGCLCLLIWAGRRSTSRSDRNRLARGFFAAFAAVAAVVAGLRGAWIVSAGLIMLSAIVGRWARAQRNPLKDTRSMNDTQARSILGVGPTADRAEIQQAYRRLMRRVHPDAGGAVGLAAQLNAARDLLLK